MQLGAAGGRDRRLDRLADEVVPEPERLAVVGEDAVVERLRDPVLAVGRDEGEHGQRDASPDHRRCIDRAARGRPETPDARQGGVAHGARHLTAGRDRLDDQERVPARRPQERGRVDAGRLGQGPDRRRGQRLQREASYRRRGHEVADEPGQGRVRRKLVVPVGHEHDDGRRLDAPRHQADDVQRGRVGPVRVLDHRDRRWLPREELEQRRRERQPVIAGELAQVGRSRGSGELADRKQRHGYRQRLAGADQEPGAIADLVADGAHQRRLADARLAPHQHQRAAARACPRDGVSERRDIGIALEEHGHAPSLPLRQTTRCVGAAPGAVAGSRGSGSSLRQSGEGRSPRSSL